MLSQISKLIRVTFIEFSLFNSEHFLQRDVFKINGHQFQSIYSYTTIARLLQAKMEHTLLHQRIEFGLPLFGWLILSEIHLILEL